MTEITAGQYRPFRESGAQKTLALLLAVGMHVVMFGVLFIGVWASVDKVEELAGEPIEAILIDAKVPKMAALPPKPAAETPKPLAAADKPKPESVKTPESTTKPEDVTDLKPKPQVTPQQTPDPMAQIQADDKKHREEIEKQRIQQMADLEQQQKDAEKARLAAQAKVNELNDQKRKQAEDDLRRKMEEDGNQLAGTNPNASLEAQYASMLTSVIRDNWFAPPDTPEVVGCRVQFHQVPGGEVVGTPEILRPCSADARTQQTIIDAVMRASPMPYSGFESVFRPIIIVPFSAKAGSGA
jgi:colicin import membrane protein